MINFREYDPGPDLYNYSKFRMGLSSGKPSLTLRNITYELYTIQHIRISNLKSQPF